MSQGKDSRATGGRPPKPSEERRTERISFGVTKAQKAMFLVNAAEAGMASNDYARATLCAPSELEAARGDHFELVDMLARIGADLARLRFIAEQTGVAPPGLAAAAARLDRALDHVIIGSGLADALEPYRDRLSRLAERMPDDGAEAARLIRRVDQVVAKVLSA